MWWEVSAPVYDEVHDKLFTFATVVQADAQAPALVELVKAFALTRRSEKQKLVGTHAKARVLHRDSNRDIDGEILQTLVIATELAKLMSKLTALGVTREQLVPVKQRKDWWMELSDQLDEREQENEKVGG